MFFTLVNLKKKETKIRKIIEHIFLLQNKVKNSKLGNNIVTLLLCARSSLYYITFSPVNANCVMSRVWNGSWLSIFCHTFCFSSNIHEWLLIDCVLYFEGEGICFVSWMWCSKHLWREQLFIFFLVFISGFDVQWIRKKSSLKQSVTYLKGICG